MLFLNHHELIILSLLFMTFLRILCNFVTLTCSDFDLLCPDCILQFSSFCDIYIYIFKYDGQEFNLLWIWCTECPQSQVLVLRIYYMLTKPVWNIKSFENCSLTKEFCVLESTSTRELLVTLIISNQWATSATVEAIFHMSGHVNRRNFRRRCIESQ